MQHPRCKSLLAGLLFAALAASGASAEPESPQSCLEFSNASSVPNQIVSVVVEGLGERFWAVAPHTTVTLSDRDTGQVLRSATFTIRVYDGVQGSNGQLLDSVSMGTTVGSYGTTATNRTLLTYVDPKSADERSLPECRSTGFWLALFHD